MSVSVPIVRVSDRIRMPKGLIPMADIKDRYHLTLYDDSKCNTCSNLPDRDPANELCEKCPAFNGVHRFYSSKELKEGIISLPQGDSLAVKSYLRKSGKDFKWIDKRPIHEMEHSVRFTGSLYGAGETDEFGNPRTNQKSIVKKWLKKKSGRIVAKPRSGKTLMSTFIYCHKTMRVKTVVIAGKKTLLNQFYESACGVPAPRYLRGKFVASDQHARRKAFTNIPRLQRETGNQIIFMPESYAQLEKYLEIEVPDILLITYQSFIKDLSRVGAIINKYYSLMIIDEEHRVGAQAYLRFAASVSVRYRLSLTATPDRKDSMSSLTKLIMGPTVAKTSVSTLKPQIEFYAVNAKPKTDHKSWHGAKKWLKLNKERNNEIVKLAFQDLRSGYDVIIIPVEHKDHMEYLIKQINHQADLNHKKRGENWPAPLARPFTRGVDEVETLNWVDSRDKREKVHKDLPTRSPRILVAILSMIKEGVDMRRPSMLYSIIPASAKYGVGAPQIQQLTTRVATPADKPQPVVRVFVDNIHMFASCASSLLFNEFLPNSTIKKKADAIYLLPNYAKAKELVKIRTQKKRPMQSAASWW